MDRAFYGSESDIKGGITKGWIAGLFSGVLWGLDASLLRYVLMLAPFMIDPVLAVWGYFVCCLIHEIIGVIGMSSYLGARGKLKNFKRLFFSRDGLLIMTGALFGGPFAITCYIFALAKGGLALTAGITSAYPLICTVMAVWLLKERLHPRSWLGIMVVVLGVFYIWYTPDEEIDITSWKGSLLALGAAVGWATEGVLGALGMKSGKISHGHAMLIREITSSVAYLIFTPLILGGVFNLGHAVSVVFSHTEAWILLIVAAISGMVSYYLWYKAIYSIGASRAVCLNVTYAFWAVLFGSLLFKLDMTGYDYFGALLVLIGVCTATIYYPRKVLMKGVDKLGRK